MATITVTKGYAGSGGTGWTSGETATPEKLNLAQTPSVAVADIETADLEDGAVTAGKLAGTLDLTGKTVTLPASSVGAAALATNAVETGKINDGAVTASKLSGAQSGAAPIYGCRAWVNFDGTRDSGGAASAANTNRFIRAAGNVASVLRNGTGNYTITLTTALPDANYAVTFGGRRSDDVGNNEASPQLSFSNPTTSSFNVGCQDNDSNTYREASDVCVAVFR